jgi:hypothetical protein
VRNWEIAALEALTLLRLVFDTAALRSDWSATVLKASRSNVKSSANPGFSKVINADWDNLLSKDRWSEIGDPLRCGFC